MEQFEVNKKITYRWWREDGKIDPDHVEALRDHADSRIASMTEGGMTSGELLHDIILDNETEEVVSYRGYWEIKNCE